MSDPKLVWLDLETTGLDPKKGSILEIGVIVTDLELNEIERRSWVLQYSRDSILTSMNDFVLNMHMSNGLLKKVWATRRLGEVVTADFLHRLDVDRAKTILGAHAWIRRATADTEAKDCYLAGSSIHFDRAWLVEHAPEIVETVSYRMVDVSTFRVAFPGLLIDQERGDVTHRALTDLEFSIDQLRQMREKLGLGGGIGLCLPNEGGL